MQIGYLGKDELEAPIRGVVMLTKQVAQVMTQWQGVEGIHLPSLCSAGL